MSSNHQKPWVVISVAIIGLIGTIATAYFSYRGNINPESKTNGPTPSPSPLDSPTSKIVTPPPEPKPDLDPAPDLEPKRLIIKEAKVENENVLSPEYGPDNLIDNDCDNLSYWATKEGSSNDAVLNFILSTPSTVSEVRLYSMRFKGRATQPKKLSLYFFDEFDKKVVKPKELIQEIPISRDWVKHEFDPVKDVKRIQMRTLEPLNASATFLSFNEVRFYGPSNDDPKIDKDKKECLNYQKDFKGKRI